LQENDDLRTKQRAVDAKLLARRAYELVVPDLHCDDFCPLLFAAFE
jgi:hypothetical protein